MREDLHKKILSKPRLYGVSFVQDYYQLQFDWGVLTVNTDPKVTYQGTTFVPESKGFRDALCSLIDSKITSWEDDDGQLMIGFEDGNMIALSLRIEDVVGPEAAVVDFAQQGTELPVVVYSSK